MPTRNSTLLLAKPVADTSVLLGLHGCMTACCALARCGQSSARAVQGNLTVNRDMIRQQAFLTCSTRCTLIVVHLTGLDVTLRETLSLGDWGMPMHIDRFDQIMCSAGLPHIVVQCSLFSASPVQMH
jgi:hypothetical protein